MNKNVNNVNKNKKKYIKCNKNVKKIKKSAILDFKIFKF